LTRDKFLFYFYKKKITRDDAFNVVNREEIALIFLKSKPI